MSDLSFWVESLPTGQIVTQDLDLHGWDYELLLNRGGSLNAQMPLAAADATQEVLDPWRTAVYVVRNDTKIEWGGVLLPPTLGAGNDALDLTCFEWLGYWDLRTIRRDRQFSDTEQFDIFETLVSDAQDEGYFGAGYDLGISVVWTDPSGVERDRLEAYRVWQAKNLGEALRQLAGAVDGFDFSMEYDIDTATDRVEKRIRLHYPRKGRDTGHLFEFVRGEETNVLARGFADPGTLAWAGDGWGEGQDEARLVSPYVDDDLRGIYPPYDAAPAWSSVSEQATLDSHTEGFFARRSRPRRVPVIRVDPEKYPLWGTYELGDIVGWRCEDGYGSTGTIPERWRITGLKVDSARNHDVTLGDPLGDEAEEE